MCFETLEGRLLLATVNWVNAAGGAWDVGSNWSTGTVPGAGDDAVINTTSAATVTIQGSDAESVHSLTTAASDTLALNGGSLAVGANSTLTGNFNLGGGTINVASGAVLTLAGTASTWSGGAVSGSLAGSGSGTVSVGNFTVGTGGATFNFPGSMWQWNQGDTSINLNGQTLTNTGTMGIVPPPGWSATLAGPGTLANQGTINMTGSGATYFSNAAVLDNQAGGTLGFQAGSIGAGNNGGTLTNEGTITMTGTGSCSIGGIAVVNNGAISPASGALAISGGTLASTTGTFTAAQGAVLQLAGGAVVTGTFAGSGSGTVSVGNLTVGTGGATFDFPGSTLQWNQGDTSINLNGQTLTNTGTMGIVPPPGWSATLVGPGTLANQGTINMTGSAALYLNGGCVMDNQAGAALDFQSDVQINAGNGGGTLSNEGTISMTAATGTTTVSGVGLASTGAIDAASGTLSISPGSGTTTGGTFAVAAGGTLDLSGASLAGSTFSLAASGSAAISGGSLAGGNTFNVAQGAAVNLGGGGMVASGPLTGSGGGAVNITGNLAAGLGGVTLNFPGNMLQWTSGVFSLSTGNVTNLGTIALAGSNNEGVYNDGTFDNFGTIIQTGSGNLALHSDNVTATTLVIEPGASYLLESNSGISNDYGGVVALVNEGTIKKTAGSGTSQLYVNGALSNGGTIEADSGTLYLDANSITQVSSGTLAGGTWNAVSGAKLQFPASAAITADAASLTLSGAGAGITGISGLTSNSGSLTVSGGANFTTTGDLANSGSLTAGAGSTITVAGNFTQTAGGTLGDQIGGTPASGQFGKVAVAKAAALAGEFDLSLAGGFAPSSGQQYPVMTFASASGSFTNFFGLGGLFTESLSSTALRSDRPCSRGRPGDEQRDRAHDGDRRAANHRQLEGDEPEQPGGPRQLAGQRLPLAHAGHRFRFAPLGLGRAQRRAGRVGFVQREPDGRAARRRPRELLPPGRGRQPVPDGRFGPREQRRGGRDRPASARRAGAHPGHAQERRLHRRRPGPLLPGLRAGRRLARGLLGQQRLLRRDGPVPQPGRPAGGL